MSTSDPKAGASVPGVDVLELQPLAAAGIAPLSAAALPGTPSLAGWPDPQLMAAWANEFFRGAALTAADPAARAPASGATIGSELRLPLARAGAQVPGATSQGSSAGSELALPLGRGGAGLPMGPPGSGSFPGTELASPFGRGGAQYPSNVTAGTATSGHELAAGLGQANALLPFQSLNQAWHVPGVANAPVPSTSQDPSQAGFYFLEQAGWPAAPSGIGPETAETDAANASQSATTAAPVLDARSPELTSQPTVATVGGREAPALADSQVLGRRQFDPYALRRDFPILGEIVNGKRLVWLDNAATTQKPQAVIDRISYFYEHENSNIHRAAHSLAARSTDAYEGARESTRRFINASSSEDIVFVRGTTEAINLVAQSWGRRNLRAGDEIVISWLEHHSNIVPWQLLCAETGACLRVAPIDDDGQVLLDEYERLMGPRTRLVSFTQVSNALGSVQPAREMVEIAHRYGARVLVDGAQAVSHMRVDVQALDCDFYAFSGHKVFGPTGIGVLYGKRDVLQFMPPWQGGGNMIVDVTFDKTVYAPSPARFEAGTGNIADAVGLGAALEYVERIGIENVARHEHELLEYATAQLLEIPRLRLIGTAREKAGVLGFVIDGIPTEQIGAALAKEGIAVRAGHHCAQPALRRYGLEATVRPSLALYNTREDIDALVSTLEQLQSSWQR